MEWVVPFVLGAIVGLFVWYPIGLRNGRLDVELEQKREELRKRRRGY